MTIEISHETLSAAFGYQPRTHGQWARRRTQTSNSSLGEALPEPSEPEEDPELEPDEVSELEPDADEIEAGEADDEAGDEDRPQEKITTNKKTPCVCEHPRGVHNLRRPMYPSLKDEFSTGDHSLISTPCESTSGCTCWNFCHAGTLKQAKLKKPEVLAHTLCAICGHARGLHCKPPIRWRLRPEWRGFEFAGVAYQCQHTLPGGLPYRCQNTACAVADESLGFCSCTLYVSPLKKRAKAPAKATPAPKAAKVKAPAKPRKPRKKKTSATDPLFPPGIGEVQS